MDPESRDLIESAYRTGPGYQQPAVDDYGYGDPGYSDPSYEGPKTPYNGSAFPGHPGAGPNGPAPRPGTAYPEQWYGSPRLDDRAAGDVRRPADPRLEGMNYGELRYDDDPDPRSPGDPGPDEPPDESWHHELRRGGPARPQHPGSPGASGPAPGGAGPGGPRRRPDGPGYGRPSGPGPQSGSGFLAAPVALLTPPDGIRIGAPRPGHGLDGPEITSSWPVQPAPGDLDSYDDFWRDDEDEEYTGLFGDRGAEFDRADAKQAAAKRSTGRRRGRSRDHRLWLALGGVVVVAAGAIVGILKFEFPSHSGPAHTMTTPAAIGGYTRTMNLERQTDVAQLRDEVIKMSSGQASDVRSAVYEKGNSQAGDAEQIVMFIGGHLANADPAASITSFAQKFPGAHVVGAGSLGGRAACVQEGAASNAVAMCAWFDSDSFGEIVSPTMSATALAQAMQTFRPAVEHLAQK
jgi:hypothetical protein